MGNKCNSNLKIIQSGLLWNLIAEFHEMWVVFFYWLRKHQCQGNTLAKYEVSELCNGEGKSGHCLAPSIGYLCIGFKKTECVFENRNLLSDPVNWRLLLIRDVANKLLPPHPCSSGVKIPHLCCSRFPFSCRLLPLSMPKGGHSGWVGVHLSPSFFVLLSSWATDSTLSMASCAHRRNESSICHLDKSYL